MLRRPNRSSATGLADLVGIGREALFRPLLGRVMQLFALGADPDFFGSGPSNMAGLLTRA